MSECSIVRNLTSGLLQEFFRFEMALDYRAVSRGVLSMVWFQHSVGAAGGVVGCPPSALSTKVGEVPRRCPLQPVDPPVSLGAPTFW